MFSSTLRRTLGPSSIRQHVRSITTLPSNPHIYVFPSPTRSNEHVLSLLDTEPVNADLAIGTTSALPPTPDSLQENPRFMKVLYEVLAEHAVDDPLVRGQAAAFASSSGSALGSGGMFFPQQQRTKGRAGASSKVGDGAGGASSQGGAGGGGRGGWVHVSDARAPPDYGRIAWPEDIFGSLEVDGRGEFVEASGQASPGSEGGEIEKGRGNWQTSGSYRVVTREGILGLSGFLRGKVVERLRREEGR